MLQTIGGSDLEPIAVVVGSIQDHIIVNNNLHEQCFNSTHSSATKIKVVAIKGLLLTITSNPTCA